MAVQLEVGKAYRTRGGERVEITGHCGGQDAFPFVSGNHMTFRVDGRHCHKDECDNDIIAEWSDEPAEPEIDWGGELQMFDPDEPKEGWNDVTVVWHDDEWVVGWHKTDDPGWAQSWRMSDWQFRNKPPEVKRVKGWVNVYKSHSPSRDWCVICYRTRSDADKAAANYRCACIEIDVAEGEGLNNE